MIPLADAPVLVPLWVDPAFKTALVGLVGALTLWVGWLMRERKTTKDSANLPGTELRRKADEKMRSLEGEVKDLAKGLADLSEKADDLAHGIERASHRIDTIDEKVDEAKLQVAEVATDMEWVKKALEAIGRKLGI